MDKSVETEQLHMPEVEMIGPPKTVVPWEDTVTAVRKSRLTRPRTLTICGYAHLSRHLAPYDSRTTEIWGVNEQNTAGYMQTAEGKFRADRWFQMHKEEDWSRTNNPNDLGHPDWLRSKHNFPIVMQEKYPDVPDAEAFPLDECDQLFFKNAYAIKKDGTIVPWLEEYEHGYYSSSFVWMLAYALWQKETGATEWENIDIYGFHAASQSEYMYQKPSAEWWISQAMARDVNVRIVENSPLMQGHLYGYKVSDVLLPSQVIERIDELKNEVDGLKELAFQQHGARLMVDALNDNEEFVEALPKLKEIKNQRRMEELGALTRVNFYMAALSSSEQILRNLEGRHLGEDGASGWVDRMSLEVQIAKFRDQVIDARSSLDAVSGALQECRLMQIKYEHEASVLASFELRETALINKMIAMTSELNGLLGLISNLEIFVVNAEGRIPNVTDEFDFGYIVIPDLFDPNLDVLTLGDAKDGKTREEALPTTLEGGTGSDLSESG